MKKIVIIGLGLGGLSFIHNLPYDSELNITIFEKDRKKNIGYPWSDSVSFDGITSAGIVLPEGVYFPKKLFNMYSPDMGGSVPQRQRTVEKGVELDRREFLKYMVECAEHKATICYDTAVKRLIIKDGKVLGVKLDNGKKVMADLVIDASGPLSKLKNAVISPFDKLGDDDILSGYRAIFQPSEGVPLPEEDSVYLKHLNRVGISWCRTTPDGNIDVFISEITDRLIKAHLEEALQDIRDRNRVLSDKLIEERYAKLVVKRPLSRFVYDGYVLVGDSAYMATPTSGSGIENALRAGRILAEVFLEAKNYSTVELWRYQTRFMRSIGANLYAKDLFRRYAQTLPVEEVNWFFTNMIGNGLDELAEADYESLKRMKVYEYVKKVKAFFSNKPLFSSGTRILSLALRAKLHVFMIPNEFEEESVALWQEKYSKILEEGDENSFNEFLNEAAADKAPTSFEDLQERIRERLKKKKDN